MIQGERIDDPARSSKIQIHSTVRISSAFSW